MHSGSWRTRLLNRAVVGGGGGLPAWFGLWLARYNSASAARCSSAELDVLAVCKVVGSRLHLVQGFPHYRSAAQG